MVQVELRLQRRAVRAPQTRLRVREASTAARPSAGRFSEEADGSFSHALLCAPPYSNPQVIVLAYKYYKDKAIEMRKQVMEYFNRYELDLE